MILGTFHFQDSGLDGFKPTDLNIFSDEKQKEIIQLVENLTTFQPTIVALESLPENQNWVDSTYAEYIKGNFELKANEVYQLGYRIAKKTNAKLICVDAKQRLYSDWLSIEDIQKTAEVNGQEKYLELWKERDVQYQAYYEHMENLKHNSLTIPEYLKLINSEQVMLHNYGWYMQKYLAIGNAEEFPWIDEWTRWYNRNYRIFGNLLRLIETGEERILLIIGSGHVPILKQCAEASPDTEYIDVLKFL